jgi:hypothetical protein
MNGTDIAPRVRQFQVDELLSSTTGSVYPIQETARVGYFVSRYGVSRAIMDGLASRGLIKKYKFGFGRSGPVVYDIRDMENYMSKIQGKRHGE